MFDLNIWWNLNILREILSPPTPEKVINMSDHYPSFANIERKVYREKEGTAVPSKPGRSDRPPSPLLIVRPAVPDTHGVRQPQA